MQTNNEQPSISVILPTYNAAGILKMCLQAIKEQNYPQDKIEIVVGDGGSEDNTLEIAKKYGAKVYNNPKKTGEHGKAVAISKASGEILALIDSDNILLDKEYFSKIDKTFKHKNVIGAQPKWFEWRKEDGSINRYTALLGMVDPFVLFQGTYDHLSQITNKWTGLAHKEAKKDGYIIAKFQKKIPTIGANGFCIRKSMVDKYFEGDYYVDIDIVREILVKEPEASVAIVETGILHLFCDSFGSFFKKQRRRIKDYLHFVKTGVRENVQEEKDIIGQILFIISTITIVPVLVQMIIGIIRKPDTAWLWHPVLCWVTLYIYGKQFIAGKFSTSIEDRGNWKQTKT